MAKVLSNHEMLKTIDRDAYILKNKIMVQFDKHFATELTRYDADDLHFMDILNAVRDENGDQVYSLLQKVANHGVTSEQKTFLYEYAQVFFSDNAGNDFEDYIEEMKNQLYSLPNMNKDASFALKFTHGKYGGALHYHQKPFWILEFFKEVDVESKPIEALLVQNGSALIIRTVHSLSEVPSLAPILDATSEENYEDDYDDDDE